MSLVIKSSKCLYNFINQDYSDKSWNHYSHFSNFIHPKENYSLLLKDHLFNVINDCALTASYHMDDNTNYLDRFSNVINGVTVLGHGILEMEVVTSIYTAISLVGLHILQFFTI